MSMQQNTLINTRIFNYSLEKVWSVRSQADLIKEWWGPNGFTNMIDIFEFEKEGKWEFTMHGPNGADYKNSIVFKEIIPQKYIHLYHMPNPGFDMKVVFVALSDDFTAVTTHQIFEKSEDAETLKKFLPTANEENFDRQGQFLETL
jgi:uncharacterized protein YndB with AHSA1/START domain